jgi:NADH:ubiquinone oxidoreductase subunit 2 (subunit N)
MGIYFYLRAIQYLFMSPEAPVTHRGSPHPLVLAAMLLCLMLVVPLGIFPGWFIARM